MKLYYFQWPDRDEIYVPKQGYVEINYGGFFGGPTRYLWKSHPKAVELREKIVGRAGTVRGKVLDVGAYEIQLPLRDGSFEAGEDVVRGIVQANAKELGSLVDAVVREHLRNVFRRCQTGPPA